MLSQPTGIRRAALLTGALLTGLIPQGKVAAQAVREALDDRRIASAWQALRTVNCERCHGKDYEGLAAPSIVDYARTKSRKAFVRMVLEGDPARGMPGYRSNPLVNENIRTSTTSTATCYLGYFVGRANGSIDPQSRP